MRTSTIRARRIVAAAGVVSLGGVLTVLGPVPAQASPTRPRPTTSTTRPTLTTVPISPVPVTGTTTTTTTTTPPTRVIAAAASVEMIDLSGGASFAFSPASITVKVGDTVTWTNQSHVGVPHTTTSDTGLWDSGIPPLTPGSSFSHVFGAAGIFPYHCRVHPFMHGTVVVNAVTPTTTTTIRGATATTRPGSTTTRGGVLGTTVTTSASSALATTGAGVNPLVGIALAALLAGLLAVSMAGRRRVQS